MSARSRWITLVACGAVVVTVGLLALDPAQHRPPKRRDAGAAPEASVAESVDASSMGDAGSSLDASMDRRLSLTAPRAGSYDSIPPGEASLLFPLSLDAGPISAGAPRSVRIGVVFVAYAGAEGAPASAPTKTEAWTRAERIMETAKGDWKAAVKEGDVGSAEDLGRIPRGVLDAHAESAVWNLERGDVSPPLDTPRGYWIVKRID